MSKLPPPLVFSGPSGSGKSTLVRRLMKEYEGCFAFSVSHTTRKPRKGEENGREYHFVTLDEMAEAIKNGDFIEHAEFSGNTYGTSKKAVDDVQATGRLCILDIDKQGVMSIKNTHLQPKYFFIKPPNMEVLEERLRSRGTETEEMIQRRLEIAKQDLEYAQMKGAYDYVITNDDLNTSYSELKGILVPLIEDLKKTKQGTSNGI